MADKIAIIIEARQTALQPLTVLPSDSFVRSVTDVSKSDLPAPEQDQPAAAVLPALPPVESQTMQIPSQIETETVDGSSQQELKDKLEVEAEAGAACDIVTEASGAQELPITIQTAAASSTSRKSSSTSKLNRVSTTRSHIPKLTPLKTSRESSPTKASTVAAATTTQPSMKPSSRPAAVTSRSRTTGEMPKSSRKIGESPVKIVRQLSASTISSSSSSSTTTTTNSSSAAKTSTQTKATPATPKANPRSFKTTENPSKRSTASVRNLNESKKTAVTGNLLLIKTIIVD